MNKPVQRRRIFLPILVAAALPVLAAAQEKAVRSPWDGKPITTIDAPYACPVIAHIAPDLVTDGFYRLDDPTHSIIDPVRQEAYRKTSDGVKAVGLAVVNAADDYRTTGSRSAAQCAMAQILTLAQEHSLAGKMSSSQAYYVQGWVVGAVAIAYIKVRETGIATPQQTEIIAKWMQSVGLSIILKFGPHGGGHRHYDKLGDIVYAESRTQEVDPGTQLYGMALHKEWDQMSVAHNTITADELRQDQATGKLTAWTDEDSYVAVTANTGPVYKFADLTRSILVTDEYALQVDRAHSTDGRP